MKALARLIAAAVFCLSTTTFAEVPTFDPATGELKLIPVTVGNTAYIATLKDVGGYAFRLQTAIEQSTPTPACAAYDGTTGMLTISAVAVGQATYRATLVNIGDYTFKLMAASEGSALCIVSQPSFRVTAAGGSARFSVGAAGMNLTYQWQRLDDGGVSFADIAGANAALYTLSDARPGDDKARFRVVVSNSETSVNSDAARLRIGPSTRKVAAGFRHVVARKADGTVVAWGGNNEGQLGDSTHTDQYMPIQVQGLTDVVAVAANVYYSLALRSDGTVWGWGDDYWGQIGDATAGGSRRVPVQAEGLSPIVAIAAGEDFALALSDEGTVFAWGANSLGQLGSGAVTSGLRQTGAPVVNLSSVAKIIAGEYTAYAIKTDGTLWGWGYNSSSNRVLAGTSFYTVATPMQMMLPGDALAADASIGDSHSLVRKTNGSLLAWGTNSGRIGDGTKLFRTTPVDVLLIAQVTTFAACFQHSLAATAPNGAPFAWGMNTAGELGNGMATDTELLPQAIPGLANVIEVACRVNGSPFNVAVTASGQVWAWGHNDFGQLGDGTTVMRTSPVMVLGLSLN